jgi:hypothetical protein
MGLLAAGSFAGCNGTTDTPTASPAVTPTATPAETPSGTPTGDIEASARTLVTRLAAGEYDAAAGQFSPETPVDAATLERVWTSLGQQGGAFVGIEGTERTTVSSFEAVVVRARFSQGLQGLRIVFDDQGRVVGLNLVSVGDAEWSPPDYVDPESIATTEVSVAGPDGCSLPGEVTVPASAAGGDGTGVPSFVLLGGSGPTDLDGSVGPNRPYRDIAYGVASAGRGSSLRFTKRTAVCELDPATLTIDDEYTTDAVAAVERLRAADGTDPERTVIAGHSLGAALAPRVATRLDGVAGLVLLAPPGRPLQDLIVEQTRYLAELDGTVTDAEQARIDEVAAAAARVDDLDIPAGETVLGGGRAYWESLQAYDAIETARDVDAPILLLHGERDYQVTAADIRAWREGLAGREGVTVETYESLNHLFVPGEGPASPEEYARAGNVAESVVTDLGEWLAARWAE